jgi:hypothetical protein
MIRIALFTAVASIASASLFLAGCSSAPDGENVEQQNGALQGAPCASNDPSCDPSAQKPCKDASDTNCTKQPPCDPSDPTCAKQPPCDPSDAACAKDPPCDPAKDPSCAKDPPCDPAKDPSCAKDPPGVDCGLLSKELVGLLAAAQVCNVASAGAKAQCAAFVPTTNGCDAPVASADADATLKYLEMWKSYASSCPLPVPACPDPKTLTTGCEQGSNVDGLLGACAVIQGPAVPPASK